MNKLITLIKINFLSAINTSTKRQSKLNKLLFGFVILFLLGISSFCAYSFVISLKEANITNFNFLIGFSVLASNFVLLFLFLSSCTNVLYKGQDNDLLFSMPIKKSTIILSKLISILLLGYIYQFVFIVPFAVLYYIYSGINFVSISCFLLGFFIQPVVVLTICCILSCFASYISKKLKHKNIFHTISLFVFFGVFLYFYMQIDLFSLMLNENGNSFVKYFPWINWYYLSITKNNLLFLLYNLILSGFLISLTYLFVYKTFFNMCTELNSTIKTKSKIYFNKKSAFASLIKKEAKKYFSSPMYIFNTLFAYILVLGFAIYCSIDKSIFNFAINVFDNSIYISICCVVLFCFFISTGNISSVSLSMERTSLSLLKSMPISYNKIIWSKILFAFFVEFPFIVVSTIIISISYKFSFVAFLILMLFSLFFCLFTCMLGITLNIWFPNLNSKNDTVLVKQSLSSFMSVVIPLVLVLVATIVYLYVSINLIYYFLICLCLLVVLFVSLLCYIVFCANKKLQKIS